MRRVLAALVAFAVASAAFLALGAGGTSGNARVDAIFDNASFLIPGQDVKIAGARVGKVSDVVLTPDNKARIEMEIDPSFTPFHADADCTIQPQSLIGEKFIDCTPGTVRAAALTGAGGHAPTVPLANTHSPVDLDLVLSTFRRPENERVQILLNELGAGVAARGDDINGAIRRANPALQETRRVLRIVSDDRRNLQQLIGAADHVLGQLAARPGRIDRFIDRSEKVSRNIAGRQAQLADAIAELPPLLRQAEPSLQALARVAREGTPILRDLRQASPQLARLADDAAPLTAAARPALTRLGTASAAGEKALDAAAPVVRKLRSFAALAPSTGALVNELFQSLKTTGSVEGLQDFIYQAALTIARFDTVSHVITPYLLPSTCMLFASTTGKGCSAHFAAGDVSARAATRARRRPAGDTTPAAHDAPAQTAPAPAAPETPQRPAGPAIQIPGLPPIELPDVLGLGGSGRDSGDGQNAVSGLLGYLLR